MKIEDTVIWCKTEKEANELLRFLHEEGFTWSSGRSLIERSYWHIYEENTCYYIDNTKESITIGNINGHNGKYTIITFKQFMRTKELKIQVPIPEELEIDIENSDFVSGIIRLKPKTLTYDNVSKELFYQKITSYIKQGADFDRIGECITVDGYNYSNNCTSRNQARKLMAINKLMNVAKYLNNGWKPDWNNYEELKYYIRINRGYIGVGTIIRSCSDIAFFKTEELAKQAIKILGEEVIKLALSTDW